MIDDDDSGDQRSVRIDPGSVAWAPTSKIMRRATAYSRPGAFESGMDIHIQSHKKPALFARFDDEEECSAPTLKALRRPSSERGSMMLKSARLDTTSEDQFKHYRDYFTNEDERSPLSKKLQINRSVESLRASMRSVAFAKRRPSISVEEYQLRNREYKKIMAKANG